MPCCASLSYRSEVFTMPSHQIFNERPESQDRALRELQAMGYQYIPRAEAEQKRGHLSHVAFD